MHDGAGADEWIPCPLAPSMSCESMPSPCTSPGKRNSQAKRSCTVDGGQSSSDHGYQHSTIDMPSIICGLDGRVVWVNEAWVRLSGFSREEILSYDHLVKLHGPGTDQLAVRTLMQQVARSQPCSAHLVCYDRSGLPFAHTLRVVPLNALNGSPRLFRLTSDAVTHSPYEYAAPGQNPSRSPQPQPQPCP